MKVLLNNFQFKEGVKALSDEIINNHPECNFAIIGIQQGGVVLAEEIVKYISSATNHKLDFGKLDVTFYRDDLHKKIMSPDKMHLPFDVDNRIIILVDDVLFTGRTIKAALDVLLDYGRPAKVELCVMADRQEFRQFPIRSDYNFYNGKTFVSDKIKIINGQLVISNH